MGRRLFSSLSLEEIRFGWSYADATEAACNGGIAARQAESRRIIPTL